MVSHICPLLEDGDFTVANLNPEPSNCCHNSTNKHGEFYLCQEFHAIGKTGLHASWCELFAEETQSCTMYLCFARAEVCYNEQIEDLLFQHVHLQKNKTKRVLPFGHFHTGSCPARPSRGS